MGIIYIAATLISIIALKQLSSVLIYLILSIFLTILLYPMVNFFQKRGFPTIIGYLFSAVLVASLFFVVFSIFNNSLKEFLNNAHFYQEKIIDTIKQANIYLEKYSFKIDLSLVSNIDFIGIIKTFFTKIGGLFTSFLIVFIGVSFMIFESKNFGNKIKTISNNHSSYEIFFKNIQKYFIIKTFTSMLTGVLVTIMLLFFDIPYSFLFGILAFLFNYIPVIGSIIAAIPAVFITFVTYGLEIFVYITIGYVIINNVISNVLEPKLMGDGLDLSPAVVFFSLLLWGWVFGAVGMFLAAPLTMVLKLALLSSKKTKWLGVLLSKK